MVGSNKAAGFRFLLEIIDCSISLVNFRIMKFKPRITGCSGLLIILKEIIQAKLPRTTQIGSDSSTIFPDEIGRPSMTTTDAGQGRFFNRIFSDKANSLSIKQELAPKSKRAEARTR